MNDAESPFWRFHQAKIARDDASVALAYCHGDVIRPAFAKSVINSIAADRGRHVHAFITSAGLYVPEGRNQIVRQFLGVGGCEWLWFLDTDVSFAPDVLDQMLLATDNGERKIVAAPYWSQTNEGRAYCTWMYLNEEGFHPYLRLPKTGAMELASCGMGCTLIHRDVFLAVAEAQDSEDPWVWFGHDLMETANGLIRAGEDISFCARAARAGHTTWGICEIQVDHLKVQPTRRGSPNTVRLWQRTARIDGGAPIATAVTEPEAQYLRHLAEGRRVLEVGGGHGYSTTVMARVAEHVTSVDPHEDEMPDSWNVLNATLKEYDVQDRVTLLRQRSSEALPDLYAAGERFSFVFIDGDHAREAVRNDVAWGLKLLLPGGYLACHDYDNEECPGVRAVLEDIPSLDVVDTLWIHQIDAPPEEVLVHELAESSQAE